MFVLYGMWYKVYVGDVGGIRGMHVHMEIWSFVCPHMHAETLMCSLQSLFSSQLNLLRQASY